MSYLSKKLILLILSLGLVVGIQTSCTSTYIFKKLILSENEENEKFEETESLESSSLHLMNNSEIGFDFSIKLLRYLDENDTYISQQNPLVITSPPNV